MNTYIHCESILPRWNYKKADWILYSQLTDQVTKDISVEGRDINKVVNGKMLSFPNINLKHWKNISIGKVVVISMLTKAKF